MQYDTLPLPHYTASGTQLFVLVSLNEPMFCSLKSFDISSSVKWTQTDCTEIQTHCWLHGYCKHIYILWKRNVSRKIQRVMKNEIYLRGEQLAGAGSPWRLNSVHWRPNIYKCSAWNVLHFALLSNRILSWLILHADSTQRSPS